MKIFKYLFLYLIVTSVISLLFSTTYSANNGEKLIKTYPLEKYMYQNYDSKGFNGYTLVLAIKQPVPGTRDVAAPDLDTGHGFIRLAKSGENAWTSYFSYNIDEVTEKEETIATVDIHKDAKNEFTLAKVFKISDKDASNVEAYLWSTFSEKKDYDIAYNNCVTFALNAAKAANIPDASLGIVPRQWVMPPYIKDNPLVTYYINLKTKEYYGYSAGDAAEDMKNTGEVVYYKDMPQ